MPPATRDFAPALASLKAAWRPDQGSPAFEALFIPDDPATVAAIAGQLADTALKSVQLLGTNLIHTPELPEAQPGPWKGSSSPTPSSPGTLAGAVQNFIAAYRQQYGEAPDYLAAQGYAVVRLLPRLLEAEKNLQHAAISPGVSSPSRNSPICPGSKDSTPTGKRNSPSISSPSRTEPCRWLREGEVGGRPGVPLPPQRDI